MYEIIVRRDGKLVSKARGENISLIVESYGQLTQSRFQNDGHSDSGSFVQLSQTATSQLSRPREGSGTDPEIYKGLLAFVTIAILDEREKEILELLSRGFTQDEMATEVNYSTSTVKRLVSGILVKMKSRDHVEALAKYLYYKGLVGGAPVPTREELVAIFTEGTTGRLTLRQTEILSCVINGKLNEQVAEELDLSVSTVKRERRNIYDRFGVGTFREVIAILAQTWNKGEAENNGGHENP